MVYYVYNFDEDGKRTQERFHDLYDYVESFLSLKEAEKHKWDENEDVTNTHYLYRKAQVDKYAEVLGVDLLEHSVRSWSFFWQSAIELHNNLHSPFGVMLAGSPTAEQQQNWYEQKTLETTIKLLKKQLLDLMVNDIKANHPDTDRLIPEDMIKPDWEGPIPSEDDLW